jgi:hypothetical protein
MLSAVWTIPLTILLCLWIVEDDEFLRFKRGWYRYRRNCLGILFAFFIVNNGIGYYAAFTCIFLVLAGLFKSLNRRSLKGLVQAAEQILLIAASYVVILIPYFVTRLTQVHPPAPKIRSIVDVELYNLKIARLFLIPKETGNASLDDLVHDYNYNGAVLQTETSEFLGVIAAIGLVALVISLCFTKVKDEELTPWVTLAHQDDRYDPDYVREFEKCVRERPDAIAYADRPLTFYRISD